MSFEVAQQTFRSLGLPSSDVDQVWALLHTVSGAERYNDHQRLTRSVFFTTMRGAEIITSLFDVIARVSHSYGGSEQGVPISRAFEGGHYVKEPLRLEAFEEQVVKLLPLAKQDARMLFSFLDASQDGQVMIDDVLDVLTEVQAAYLPHPRADNARRLVDMDASSASDGVAPILEEEDVDVDDDREVLAELDSMTMSQQDIMPGSSAFRSKTPSSPRCRSVVSASISPSDVIREDVGAVRGASSCAASSCIDRLALVSTALPESSEDSEEEKGRCSAKVQLPPRPWTSMSTVGSNWRQIGNEPAPVLTSVPAGSADSAGAAQGIDTSEAAQAHVLPTLADGAASASDIAAEGSDGRPRPMLAKAGSNRPTFAPRGSVVRRASSAAAGIVAMKCASDHRKSKGMFGEMMDAAVYCAKPTCLSGVGGAAAGSSGGRADDATARRADSRSSRLDASSPTSTDQGVSRPPSSVKHGNTLTFAAIAAALRSPGQSVPTLPALPSTVGAAVGTETPRAAVVVGAQMHRTGGAQTPRAAGERYPTFPSQPPTGTKFQRPRRVSLSPTPVGRKEQSRFKSDIRSSTALRGYSPVSEAPLSANTKR